MSKSEDDVIDLTISFSLGSNMVIDLLDTDDSRCSLTMVVGDETLSDSEPSSMAAAMENVKQIINSMAVDITKKKIKKRISSSIAKPRKSDTASPVSEKKRKFGGCPICWDELGKNPLASTKCGHVYCMKCIQEYLKVTKKCPTCRQSLKGSTPYHPLYLGGE